MVIMRTLQRQRGRRCRKSRHFRAEEKMHFKNRHFFKLSCAKTLLNVGVIGALSLGGARSAMAVILTPGSSGTPDGSISLAGDQFVSSTSSSYNGTENIEGVGTVSYD